MRIYQNLKLKLSAEIVEVPSILKVDFFPALTGLRGVAILIVLLYHLGINRFLREFDCWILGRLGVDIFFVLSGFLITTILLKEKIARKNISLNNFYRKRTLRILPVAYSFLLVMIILNYFFKCNISFKSFVCSFILIKNLPFHGIEDHWTNHFWSLSVEEQFYLFFPILIIFDINKTVFFSIVIVCSALAFSLLGYYQIGPFFYVNDLYRFCRVMMYIFWEGPFMILIGCLFSIMTFKGLIDISAYKNNYFLGATLFIAAIIVHSSTFFFYTRYLSEFIFAILIGVIILLCIDSNNLLARLLKSRFLIRLGTLSYSIYIWQQLVVWISFHWFNMQFKGVNIGVLFVIDDLIRFGLIIAIAYISYNFVELPFLNLRVKLSKSAASI
jgi:peptidoglycan/LPS O-acetylase OafA/YrhL